jgi:malonate-semialdehyde dehydrogenase (acetylating) / methylmalonate-semialdehyde dehydrogenase
MAHITHWINGKSHDVSPARTAPVWNPATGEQQAEVALAGAAEVDLAVAAAVDALPGWRETPLVARQRVLFTYRELLLRHQDDLARAVTSEHGKTLDDARGEVQRGLEVVEFACGLPHLLKGEFSEQVAGGVDMHSLRQPVGVAAGITPFNFPVMVPMWMFPMAIACGNTFVLKPSERDPSPSVLAAELGSQAGLPDGVLNVVHGDREAVDRILAHPDVAAVSFVGSTPVARHVYKTAAANGKRVQALGGAKNHMVVLPDADLELAADAAVSAAYGSAGQRCMAISVLVAVGDVGDRLVPLLRERIERLVVAPGDAEGADMGPLITAEHRDRVTAAVRAGAAAGATLVADGRDLEIDGHERGFFMGPTLFDHVTTDMAVYTEEIFGPVLSVVRAASFDDAVELVNANPYGNGAAVFTTDGGAARAFQHRIQIGMVGINVPIPVPLAFYSFGGWKQSLFGGHDVYGPEAVGFYTRPKTVIARWSDPAHRGVDLGFPTAR